MKKITSILLLLFLLVSISACNSNNEQKKYSSIDQINGSIVGVLSGTVFDEVVLNTFPDCEIRYFANNGDVIQALKEKRIDAYVNDDIQAIQLCKEENYLTFFNNSLKDYDYGFAFPKTNKGKALRDDFNIFLSEIIRNGTVDEIISKWTNNNDTNLDFSLLTGTNGTLTMATDSTAHPMSSNVNGQFAGVDIEIAYLYCLNRGYKLEINDYSFDSLIPTVTNSKADFAGAGIMITSERQENVYFSNSYYKSGSFVIVLKENYEKVPEDTSDFAGKKIGVLSGGIGERVVKENIKDPNVIEIDSVADLYTALKSGKVDGIAQSEISLDAMIKEDPAVKIVCPVYIESWCFGFQKDAKSDELRLQMNEFIHKHSENNGLQKLYEEWANNETSKVLDYESLTGDRTLEIAICSGCGQPNCYYVSGKLAGFEIDLYTMFAKEYGYKINFSDYSFAGMIAAISTGKADVGGVTIALTDERKESINFSDCYLSGYFDIAYYDQNYIEENTNIFKSIKNSFEKTFIREDRYKLFIDGIVSTSLITLSAIVIGSAFGMLLFLLFRRNNQVINTLLKVYVWFVNGTPTVVLLMVFFYIIFTNEIFTSTLVAVITFVVIFSIKTLGLLQTCFASINKEQYDAAYALGYSKQQTFLKIIFPQVTPILLPAFSSEVVALLKSTSVVGYIAVQDLTKMSDIVRSRTYESFFPLISTTIIYFVIAWIFTTIIKYLLNKIDPRKRSEEEIFKGVVRHD